MKRIPNLITGVSARLPDGKQPGKRHKYGVSKREGRTVDGIVFDSVREAERYVTLKMVERAGGIRNLRLQVPFRWECKCFANGRECNSLARNKYEKYLVDFTYEQDGKTVYEDVKGMRTKEYKRKKRIVEELFQIEITEV